jgi:hypothetical protein
MAEEKEAKDQKKTITIRVPSFNFWTITTLVLAVALIFVLVSGVGFTGMIIGTGAGGVDANTAAQKTVDYINKNLVQTGSVVFKSVSEENGMYNVTTEYNGQAISVFVSKDGKMLFVSTPFDMTKTIATTQTTTTSAAIPKADKASAQLFVMGFCPYGVQAENIMKPVVDLLGSKADIKIRFIVNVNGDTIDKVQSLHGTTEAQEDARQLCIMKYYDQATYWKYLTSMDNDCYGKITTTDETQLATCWKAAADKAGIDKAKIETCATGPEAITMLKAEQAADTQYGVSGSPTLVINGVQYSGSRTSDAFKTAICSGFNTQPSECSQTISASSTATSTAAASGGCG